ncbi:XisH family protein [Runella slithyformis]|uniref:XisH protein n=1 Tax=Runella slithyformis (strain ATCC 29530 / DSM 19594 / LMG 11500 / NCIMB 11436 / LSU 4) TaxID=761193 RepID=A0A7U3ZK27_RUNSL|nr:XisH family protein [Runella slithyformis]AEI48677.1 XisH protein [Runella slithyformis DSM 19594]
MAKDLYHDSVRTALEKEGWTITDDPFLFRLGRVSFRMDLGAEKVISAEKGTEKIVIEIKTFTQTSFIHAFHEATGQYDNYLLALEEIAPERQLFLAVPTDIWDSYFQERFIQKVVERKHIKLIIYDPLNETIVLWKS